MSNFLVKETLEISTQSCGKCYIELCLGDITRMEVQDKVDVICVSVFGNSYSQVSQTLVGNLHKNLQLSVKDLAEDKAEDLRHAYMCWWSKPLPAHLPYKRLLCFENRSKGSRPQEYVGNVFRCLVPMLNNQPGTVITPLLNTGAQGFNEVAMLSGTVNAAIKWMKAGLPLERLKIVLYANVIKGRVISMNMRDPDGILKAFTDLKKRHTSVDLIPVVVPLEYDIYLSHSTDDAGVAAMVEAKFKEFKPNIKICKSKPVLEEGAFWQEENFKMMSRCARVVPILSPAFLESKACIDLYNMALCCNRRAHRDILAPLYIEYIKDMPSYMGLVQYIDCSPMDMVKICDGCQHLVQSLEHSSMKVHTEMVMADVSPLHYDVFVSYSHRDSNLAMPIVEKIQKLNPKLRIFFDVQELKAGTAWQRMLYHGVDGSRSFLSLVSNSYMKSAMCIEEFNLALAKHCSINSTLRLIPVCIEPLIDPLPEFTKVKMIDASTPEVFYPTMDIICTSLVNWIGGKACDPRLDSIFQTGMRTIIDPADYAIERRRLQFNLEYGDGEKVLRREGVQFPPLLDDVFKLESDNQICDIAFSCAPVDNKYVAFVSKVLREYSPGLIVKETAETEHERLALMESSRKVIVFLSANYLESLEQVEELHTVLLRERYYSNTPVLFPITIHNLPQLPTYAHLIPCEYNLFDPLWMDLYTKSNFEDMRKTYKPPFINDIERYACMGVMAAVHSLLTEIKLESEQTPPPRTRDRPMLFNVMLLRSEVSRLHKKLRAITLGNTDGDDHEEDKTEQDVSLGMLKF